MKKVDIWTDGGCSPNPGKGGWGVVLRFGEHYKELYGGLADSTNNRMELTAAIQGLRALKFPCSVRLHTDSKYVVQGMKQWVSNWEKNDWRTKQNKPVLNQDLWGELLTLSKRHQIEWVWVKGHADDKDNNRADALVLKGRNEL